jgi:uncharacterized hydantoinase/oxoprolinase family protein
MPTHIEKIPDAPIVIVHSQQSDDNLEEMADSVAAITRALDEQTEKVFLITDMGSISMDLNDIIQAASMSARGSNSLLHHPNVRENLFVLTDKLITMAIQGLKSATFGQVKTRVFATVEEAVSYCREQIAAGH